MFLDIHSHHAIQKEGELHIADHPGNNKNVFTFGIHPQFAAEPDEKLAQLQEYAKMQNCIGIGECGLDRRYAEEIPMQKQTELFQKQIALAENLRKPLIIHSVRTHEDIRQLKKKLQPEVPWILHGFRGNERSAITMLDAGFCLSFGEGLLRDAGNVEPYFSKIPMDRIFFETDEAQTDIRAIYALAASMYGIGIGELETQIMKNYERVFLHG